MKLIAGVNDLATTHPELIPEWSPKNEKGPECYMAGSNAKVLWECSRGHEWPATIHNRALNKTGCPYCAGKLPIPGETDLATTHPELIPEWSPKNEKDPECYTAGSNAKVLWECIRGHEWPATILHRALNKRGCPYCAGKLPIIGETDLATTHPELIAEWSPKNEKGPECYTAGSSAKVLWECIRGHEWPAVINSRALKKTGCPYCAGQLPIVGETDLATTHPELIAEWSPKNEKGPECYTAGSSAKVLWECIRGHEWPAVINSRALNKAGCPFCAGRLPIPGETDLATTHPELIAEWSPKNEKGPECYMAGSTAKVLWECIRGHEWPARINNRALNKAGCPYCAGKLPIPGETDLATTHPELIAEWSPKNEKGPECYTAGSNAKVLWECSRGHEWPARINSRTLNKAGCPYCAGQLPIVGETDLATTHPELIAEWSPKNEKGPECYTAGSNAKVLWECIRGHEWPAKIFDRALKKNGCRECRKIRSKARQII